MDFSINDIVLQALFSEEAVLSATVLQRLSESEAIHLEPAERVDLTEVGSTALLRGKLVVHFHQGVLTFRKTLKSPDEDGSALAEAGRLCREIGGDSPPEHLVGLLVRGVRQFHVGGPDEKARLAGTPSLPPLLQAMGGQMVNVEVVMETYDEERSFSKEVRVLSAGFDEQRRPQMAAEITVGTYFDKRDRKGDIENLGQFGFTAHFNDLRNTERTLFHASFPPPKDDAYACSSTTAMASILPWVRSVRKGTRAGRSQ